MNKHLEKLETRQLLLLMSGIALLLLATFTTYFISPQFKEYRNILKSHDNLSQKIISNQNLINQLQSAKNSVTQLNIKLHGDIANLPISQIESYLIGRLQQISWRHNVELTGIKPSAKKEINSFQEVVFRVNLAGNYFDLYSWIKDLRKELRFTVIQQFEMHPIEQKKNNSRLAASLTIASYIGSQKQ